MASEKSTGSYTTPASVRDGKAGPSPTYTEKANRVRTLAEEHEKFVENLLRHQEEELNKLRSAIGSSMEEDTERGDVTVLSESLQRQILREAESLYRTSDVGGSGASRRNSSQSERAKRDDSKTKTGEREDTEKWAERYVTGHLQDAAKASLRDEIQRHSFDGVLPGATQLREASRRQRESVSEREMHSFSGVDRSDIRASGKKGEESEQIRVNTSNYEARVADSTMEKDHIISRLQQDVRLLKSALDEMRGDGGHRASQQAHELIADMERRLVAEREQWRATLVQRDEQLTATLERQRREQREVFEEEMKVLLLQERSKVEGELTATHQHVIDRLSHDWTQRETKLRRIMEERERELVHAWKERCRTLEAEVNAVSNSLRTFHTRAHLLIGALGVENSGLQEVEALLVQFEEGRNVGASSVLSKILVVLRDCLENVVREVSQMKLGEESSIEDARRAKQEAELAIDRAFTLESSLRETREALKQSREEVSILQQKSEEYRRLLEDARTELRATSATTLDLRAEVESLEKLVHSHKRKVQEAETKETDLIAKQLHFEAVAEEKDKELSELKAALREVRDELSRESKKRDERENKLHRDTVEEMARKQAELEQARDRATTELRLLRSVQEDKEIALKELKESEEKYSKLEVVLAETRAEHQHAATTLEHAEREKERLKHALHAAQLERDELKRRVDSMLSLSSGGSLKFQDDEGQRETRQTASGSITEDNLLDHIERTMSDAQALSYQTDGSGPPETGRESEVSFLTDSNYDIEKMNKKLEEYRKKYNAVKEKYYKQAVKHSQLQDYFFHLAEKVKETEQLHQSRVERRSKGTKERRKEKTAEPAQPSHTERAGVSEDEGLGLRREHAASDLGHALGVSPKKRATGGDLSSSEPKKEKRKEGTSLRGKQRPSSVLPPRSRLHAASPHHYMQSTTASRKKTRKMTRDDGGQNRCEKRATGPDERRQEITKMKGVRHRSVKANTKRFISEPHSTLGGKVGRSLSEEGPTESSPWQLSPGSSTLRPKREETNAKRQTAESTKATDFMTTYSDAFRRRNGTGSRMAKGLLISTQSTHDKGTERLANQKETKQASNARQRRAVTAGVESMRVRNMSSDSVDEELAPMKTPLPTTSQTIAKVPSFSDLPPLDLPE